MPNLQSSFKRVRVAAKKAARNRPIRTAARTSTVRAEKLITGSDAAAAQAGVLQAIQALDRATSKGVIHRNTAARKKSRLMKKLNASTAQA